MTHPINPILLVGGFLTDPPRYEQFGLALRRVTGRPIFVAPIGFPDWLWATVCDDFTELLRKLAGVVNGVLHQTGAERVTLVTHSAGGVLARMFIGDQPYGSRGICCRGYRYIDRLITVGTPHFTLRSGRQAGLNQVRYVTERYPGTYCPEIEYVTVMGTGIEGMRHGSFFQRAAFSSYALFTGEGNQLGDGIVPVSCGLLEGARHVLLPDIHHGPRALRPWYGEDDWAIRRWLPEDLCLPAPQESAAFTA